MLSRLERAEPDGHARDTGFHCFPNTHASAPAALPHGYFATRKTEAASHP